MLTVVTKNDGMSVVKNHHKDLVFGYQVHDDANRLNPVIDRFDTKAEADEFIGVGREKSKPKAKAKKRVVVKAGAIKAKPKKASAT